MTIVLWSGATGGTETLMCELARTLRHGRSEHPTTVLFVDRALGLATRLHDAQVPFAELGLKGLSTLLGARRLARALNVNATGCAILPTVSYLAPVLRFGGYDGRIVSVDHGAIENLQLLNHRTRARRILSRWAGVLATDIQVGVSDYMLSELRRLPHARDVRRIYNGVDVGRYSMAASVNGPAPVRFGFAGRHIHGKGLATLLNAFRMVLVEHPSVELHIAGSGPETRSVHERAEGMSVVFHGVVDDMPTFWRMLDVCVVPSDSFVETFGMVAAEAMACGLPVIASRNGALPELVVHELTGIIVEPGDAAGLAASMGRYAADADSRARHGQAGRDRCVGLFSIERTANEYISACRCGS